MKAKHILLPALALLLAGCAKDEIDTLPPAGGAIDFEIGFAGTDAQTRVATDAEGRRSAWETGDQIGIFALPAGETLKATGNTIHNVPLTYDGAEWQVGPGLVWPGGGSLDFYAYHPYVEGTDPTAITHTIPIDQSANRPVDLLTASAAGQGRGSTVALTFHHKMALVQVNVSERGPSVDYPAAPVVRLTNAQTALAPFGLQGGTPTGAGDRGNITMRRVDMGYPDQYVYRALVPPQTIHAGSLFSVTVDYGGSAGEADFRHSVATPVSLTAGAAHKWNIRPDWNIDPNHVYAVGDKYPHRGPARGIVYKITDGGRHGMIVSLDEALQPWGPEDTSVGATSETDGLANMAAMIIDDDFSRYPAFV